jgi:Ca-activated chloride channel homolog
MLERLGWIALTVPGFCLYGQEPFHISVDVDLVVLHATVRDHDARLVTHLYERDVELFEDGARQTIRLFQHEDTPVTVGLVVDHSGSMRHKLADVVAGARRFARSSNPLDQMFVVNFNERVSLPLPATAPFTSVAGELERAITRDTPAGKTALYDAVAAALERLRMGERDKRVLIVISDGGDNASTHTLADVLRMAALSSALIYTVGVFDATDPDRNPRVLRQLAKATGGESFFPAGPAEIVEVCDRIALDVRQHYTVGFVSSNAIRDGRYRSIRLVARQDGRKLSVRTRAGYVAGAAK